MLCLWYQFEEVGEAAGGEGGTCAPAPCFAALLVVAGVVTLLDGRRLLNNSSGSYNAAGFLLGDGIGGGTGRLILSLLIDILPFPWPNVAGVDLLSQVDVVEESVVDPLPVRFSPRIPPAKGFLFVVPASPVPARRS